MLKISVTLFMSAKNLNAFGNDTTYEPNELYRII